MTKPHAILLLGPTGSGKTPLGDHLAARGLWGRPCAHFDFGHRLRSLAAASPPPPGFSHSDLDFLRNILHRGALLENHHFHIAERILTAFLEAQAAHDPAPLVVLNGLPRHVDQARDVDRLLSVRAVVVLSCPPDVVLARIASNAGGDRTGRSDDAAPAVGAKLELFARRTAPLIDHYAAAGAALHTLEISLASTPESLLAELQARPPQGPPPC